MFDYGNLNDRQKQAVLITDGPLLIIAGPGTGKTFTLVKRVAYLIKEKNVAPGEIMAVTFTEKAARELMSRIADEFVKQGIDANVNDMYIGTFHALCLRLLKEYGKADVIGKRRMMDRFEQTYLVAGKMDTLSRLRGFSSVIKKKSKWEKAEEVCRYVNQMREELVDIDALLKESDSQLYFLGRLADSYRYHILEKQNTMDFSSILTETYRMLTELPEALADLRSKIRYILVDEYQDTNYIQEQLVFLIAGEQQNICVVGDDDQGMYRFRGATIRNILEFPSHFPEGVCQKVYLETNYRSAPGIIELYNRWMKNAEGVNLFNWNRFRFDKTIQPHLPETRNASSTFALWRDTPEEEAEALAQTVQRLRENGTITDYSQAVCLLRSVKSAEAKTLMAAFEAAGIPVYAPRSERFFERDEIRLVIGALLLCFRKYVSVLKDDCSDILPKLRDYYTDCIQSMKPYCISCAPLWELLKDIGKRIASADEGNGLSLLDIFYRLQAFEPFSGLLNTGSEPLADRAARNLAAFSHMLSRFSYLYDLHEITGANIELYEKYFFGVYLKEMYLDGAGEYEDETQVLPRGCVSFMTIHQAKGLEFPVTIVGSLSAVPKEQADAVWLDLENHGYLRRLSFEPYSDIKYFDFWRLYYTAISRAQDVLILACGGKSKFFGEYMRTLPDALSIPENTHVSKVKQASFRRMYSFTSHVSVYDGCPKQYLFYKEYGFAQHKMLQTSLGSLVHACLEDINNHAIAGHADELNDETIMGFFEANYAAMQSDSGYNLTPEQTETALAQVLSYYRARKDALSRVWKAEEEIRLNLPDFILQGVIDLMETADGDVEIVDYKTGPKPDPRLGAERVAHYKKQLEIYAYLVEKHYGKRVKRMHLYYTAAPEDPWISFAWTRESVDSAVEEVRQTVKRIEQKDFSGGVNNRFACEYCDMKYYCKKAEVRL